MEEIKEYRTEAGGDKEVQEEVEGVQEEVEGDEGV